MKTKQAAKKKDKNVSLYIVIASFTIVLAFSIAAMFFAYRGIELSSTLVEYFFKFFGFELVALSGIKISKTVGSAFGRVQEDIEEVEATIDGSQDESEVG